VGREVEVSGDPPFQRERIDGCEETDGRGGRPESQRLVLEHEAADRGPDEEADLPRGAGKGHVTPEQLRLGEVDDERSVDRSVQALGQREDADGDAEHDGRLSAGEPGASGEHPEQGRCPDHAHQRESAQTPSAFDELDHRELAERDSGGEDEPDHPDRRLADMRGVLRERWQQLAHHSNACADQDDVQDDVGEKDAIAGDVCVAARLTVLLTMAR